MIQESKDPRKVAVMYGRDLSARNAVVDLLRRLGLDPLEWSDLVKLTENAAPYNGEAVSAAFAEAQAVVVVLTPDDVGFLHPDLLENRDGEDDRKPTGQARLNVILEAGMALQSHPRRTVLVEIGHTRAISDLAGRSTVRLDGQPRTLNDLATRLARAGCPVSRDGSDWLEGSAFAELAAHTRKSPIDGATSGAGDADSRERIRAAHRQARHLAVECSTIDRTARAALESGCWWDVRFEGLPAIQWREARDLLADEAPRVYDAVAPAFVTADQINKTANHDSAEDASFQLLDERRRKSLERLVVEIENASAALREYCDARSPLGLSHGATGRRADTARTPPHAALIAVTEQATEEASPDAIAALARRAYRESTGNMKPLLAFLADNPDREIPFTEASAALGFTSAFSMPGLLGAFGRRANHRYGGKWPFRTFRRDGVWHVLMTPDAAAAIRDVGPAQET